ncbi:hypothetical protein, partial [Phocaeicola vulgatus]
LWMELFSIRIQRTFQLVSTMTVIIWRLLDRKNGCHFPCRQTITDFRPRAKIVMGKAAAVVHNKL